MSTNPRTTSRAIDLEHLLDIINPSTGVFTCVGQAPSKGRRCRIPIARHNQQAAYTILHCLPSYYNDGGLLRQKLKDFASAGLCQRYHQVQISAVADRWYQIIAANLRGMEAPSPTVDDLEAEILRRQREMDQLRQRQRHYRQQYERRQQQDCREQQAHGDREECHQREEARREEARQEEQRREAARQAEERREQERRQEEARREQEEQARQQREARQRADAQVRAELERQQRERLERVWADSWATYDRDWANMQRVDTANLDEAVIESVPWPVKSSRWQDVNEANVRSFLRHAPDGASENRRKFRTVLRGQALRWHEDKLLQFFPRIARDEASLRLAKLVMQVVNDLTGILSSL